MTYRLSTMARDDIRAIYRDGVRTFGEAAAKRYAGGLQTAFLRLSDFPALGPAQQSYDSAFRTLACGVHVILYRAVPNDEILILRVRHAREDWQNEPGVEEAGPR